jgi:hypothetical protein
MLYIRTGGAMSFEEKALAESESFWIANAMYLAFVLSAFTSSVVKVVAHRRGL